MTLMNEISWLIKLMADFKIWCFFCLFVFWGVDMPLMLLWETNEIPPSYGSFTNCREFLIFFRWFQNVTTFDYHDWDILIPVANLHVAPCQITSPIPHLHSTTSTSTTLSIPPGEQSDAKNFSPEALFNFIYLLKIFLSCLWISRLARKKKQNKKNPTYRTFKI